MASRSTIERLPQEVLDVCHRLIREGKTIHEITDKLNELDAEVSKSAVGRYVMSSRAQMKRFREAQEVAGRWVSELGENSKGDVATLCQQMLTGIAFQTLDQVAQQQLDGEAPTASRRRRSRRWT
jgi:predicted transcriptional regulator